MKYWILAGIIVLGLSGCADTGGGGDSSSDAVDGSGDGTTDDGGTVNDDPSTVIVTATLPPGDQCPNGGITVESGIDENGNGVLDDSEVDLVQIVCNGEDGTAGADGAPGADGADGTDNAAIADIACAAGLEGQPNIFWFYHATLLNSGDVIVTGSVWTLLFEVAKTVYYSAQQVGAVTGSVVFTYDLAGSANGGFWELTLDRETLIVSIIYRDVDFAPNPMTWIQTPDKCIVNDFI